MCLLVYFESVFLVCSYYIVGKWQRVTCLEELRESGIFETASGGYICADDTGYFSVGDVRGEGMYVCTLICQSQAPLSPLP